MNTRAMNDLRIRGERAQRGSEPLPEQRRAFEAIAARGEL
jgi:hypothetical protein